LLVLLPTKSLLNSGITPSDLNMGITVQKSHNFPNLGN
jgi:hypothetical protein